MRQFLRTVSRTIKASSVAWQSAVTYHKIKLLYPRVQLGRNVRFYGPVHLRIAKTALVRIGDNVTFRSSTEHNFVGINRPVSIYVGEQATLDIGASCGFSGTALYASTRISIGACCNIGGNVGIWDTDFHPLDVTARRAHDVSQIASAPIRIDDDVFVGANSMLLKGTTIGARSIVGAGAVVTRAIPADQIWAGNPARYIRDTTPRSPQPEATSPTLACLPVNSTVIW